VDSSKLQGGCYCGAVRYEVEGTLGPLINCHCRFCRRAHAAAFVTVTPLPSERFRWTGGEDALREYRSGGGWRFFCERCGGRLINRPASSDGLTMLLVATLDVEPEVAPSLHINVASKAPWYEILDDKPKLPGFPPGIEETPSE